MTPPYMKLFWGDYHRKTRHLTTAAQHGAYMLLIGEAWQSGGSLPDDDAKLAAWAESTPAEWAKLKPVVMGFFAFRRGKWVHDRVREELAVYESTSRKRKEAGQKGGKSTAGKDRGNPQANALQKPTKPEPESEPDNIGGVGSAGEGAKPGAVVALDWPPDAVAQLGTLAGPGLADPTKDSGLLLSAAEVERWRQAGCSWGQDVLPIVRALTSKTRRDPISRWTYFTRQILEARDQRMTALRPVDLTGAASERQANRPDEKLARRHDNYRRAVEGALEAPNRQL